MSQIVNSVACLLFAIVFLFFFATPVVRDLFRLMTRRVKTDTDDDAAQELCDRCNYDVRGLIRCPECGADTRLSRHERLRNLREEWPTQDVSSRMPEPHETPVVILPTEDSMAARLLIQHLKARGIIATLASSKIHGAVYSTARTSYRLTVWSGDEKRARAIVQHLWPEDARSA